MMIHLLLLLMLLIRRDHTEAVVHDHRPVCASGSKFAAAVGRWMGVGGGGGGGGGYAAWSS